MANVNNFPRTPVLFNWSSGKDSILALASIRNSESYKVRTLLTTVNDHYGRVSQHGIREVLLDQQVKSLGLPLHKIRLPVSIDMDRYSSIMADTLADYKDQGIEYAVYGDIFLERVRNYRERNLSSIGMKGIFPLWKRNTYTLAQSFVEEGYRAIVVCVDNRYLDRSFVGRSYDQTFIEDLPRSVDPCGENGEFHTFVWEGPLFDSPVSFEIGETVYRNPTSGSRQNAQCPPDEDKQAIHTDVSEGLWFIDLIPETETSET